MLALKGGKKNAIMQSHFSLISIFSLLVLMVFFINPHPAFSGQVTLAWDAPTTNTDGTPLTDLAGYNVYYGTAPGNYSQKIDVGNVTTADVLNLSNGTTYYFAATAYDTSRNESSHSNEVSKTTQAVQQYSLSIGKSGSGSGVVTSSAGGINCGTSCTANYNSGSVVTLTAAPSAGSTFAGWSGGGCTGTGTCSLSINANITATANFTSSQVNAYAITATAGSGGSISPSGTVTVNSGSSKTFTITPNTGYHVSDVKVDGASVGGVTTYTFSNVTAGHTIAATFAVNTYTVTPSAGTGGSISPSTAQTVNYNATSSFTVTPSGGYSIASVSGCGGTLSGSTYTTGPITANCTVTASFILNPVNNYTITATAGTGGSISPSGAVTVSSGSGQTYTITPNTGYAISDVKVDGVSVGAVTSYVFSNVTANHTIEASFVSVSANASAITVNPTSYNFGNIKVGRQSPFKAFQISNAGKVNITVLKIAITGADASMFMTGRTSTKTLSPSASLNKEIKFKPTSKGVKNAVLQITSNDPNNPVISIPLSGTGM